MGKWGNFMLWCWESLPCALPGEHHWLWLCPLRGAVSPPVLREQPQHCLSHTHSCFWGLAGCSAVARCPPGQQDDPTDGSRNVTGSVGLGAPGWEQEVCGHSSPALPTPEQGPAAPAGLHYPGCVRGSSHHQGSCSPSCQSLAAPSVTLSGFEVYRSAFGLGVSDYHPFPNPISWLAVGIRTPLKFPKQNGNGKSWV